MSDKVVEKKNLLRVSIDFIENSNKGAVFDYIRQSIKLFIFHSLEAHWLAATPHPKMQQ